MPDILVEVRGSWLSDGRGDFLRAVHRAVEHALGTPADEPLARLIEHPASNYLIPHAAGERFTRIEITMFVGRSVEAKRRLYQAMVQNLRPFDVPAADIKIVLLEVPTENVGFRGGKAASDVDLGYSVRA